MKIAAGLGFYQQFGAKAEKVLPGINWALFAPDGSWSASPDDAHLAVLVDDAYRPDFKEAILKADDLRWLHTENSGVDGEFYERILARQVVLTRSPGANAPEVAEFVFALILREMKKLEELRRQQQERRWQRLPLESLAGKTMLVAGLGEVGGRVAAIARAFSLRVLGIQKHPEPVAGIDEVASPDRLDDFLALADIVVLALPLSPETGRLFGAERLDRLRQGAMLINVGRGGIIDIAALRQTLSARPDLRVCLDVLPEEPWPAGDDLWQTENLFITPHVAWSSPLYRPRVAELWLKNLARYRDGQPLLNQVPAIE